MDWFEEWFDSPLYEKLYASRDDEEAARLGKLIEKLIPVESFPELLDLGCGRGRHSLYLAKNGYTVTGIDLSLQAIRTAREKASKAGLENIRFEVRDMRYPMEAEFDAVINLFTTFGYFKTERENKQVIDAQATMLRKGGKIIIDFMNASKVRDGFEPKSEGSIGELSYKIKRSVRDDAIRKEIEFFGNGLKGKKNFFERVKLYEPDWFKKELTLRGFKIENVFGDYEGADFDPKTCDRFIIVATLK